MANFLDLTPKNLPLTKNTKTGKMQPQMDEKLRVVPAVTHWGKKGPVEKNPFFQ